MTSLAAWKIALSFYVSWHFATLPEVYTPESNLFYACLHRLVIT